MKRKQRMKERKRSKMRGEEIEFREKYRMKERKRSIIRGKKIDQRREKDRT